MFKWLSILIIVLCGFLIVLLALGYLLKENEVATKALKQQLEQDKLIQQHQEDIDPYVVKESVQTKQKKQQRLQRKIIIENLTCISDKQCTVELSPFEGGNCFVAVNTIGASVLTKLASKSNNRKQCDLSKSVVSAFCDNNICTIK